MTDGELDALLAQPLAVISDNGFSGRVGTRLERRHAALFAAAFACVMSLSLFAPIPRLGLDLASVISLVAESPGVMAVAALALSLLAERALARS